MDKPIMVYFMDNRKVKFDRDKATFRTEDGNVFTLDDSQAEEGYFHDLTTDGKALINWSNVCYVKDAPDLDEFDDL